MKMYFLLLAALSPIPFYFITYSKTKVLDTPLPQTAQIRLDGEETLQGTFRASCQAPWTRDVPGTYEATFNDYTLRIEENPPAGINTLSYARGIVLYTPNGTRYGKVWDTSTKLSKDERGVHVQARLDSQYPARSPIDIDVRIFCT
ncbi:hypothetical protein KBD61_05975 [Patescibacteria group bacterium]|nr:hypothetical protein [Patescibacteria group bacterium]